MVQATFSLFVVYMIGLIIACVLLFVLIRFLYRHSMPVLGTVSLVSGGVKTGKSTFAVWRCVSQHFSNLCGVKIFNFFHKSKKREIPYLYSNIPLKYPWYRELTLEMILRKERGTYGSIVYINESSLLADSKMYKDEEINESLMLFCKLFGHEFGAGSLLMWDTQSISDCHYAIKRTLSEYVYLCGKKKIPFGILLQYRKMKFSDSESSIDVNVFEGKDVKELPLVFIPSFVWKMFDSYCYSILTDKLPISNVINFDKSLKTKKILTLSRSRNNLLNVRELEFNKSEVNYVEEYKEVL